MSGSVGAKKRLRCHCEEGAPMKLRLLVAVLSPGPQNCGHSSGLQSVRAESNGSVGGGALGARSCGVISARFGVMREREKRRAKVC